MICTPKVRQTFGGAYFHERSGCFLPDLIDDLVQIIARTPELGIAAVVLQVYLDEQRAVETRVL